jgi:hypothetical protein
MNDIYKKKALKYKYKYLQLKKQYFAEGGLDEKYKNILINIDNIEYNFEFIGEGAFGCIISPPLQFNNNINIKFSESISKKDFDNIDNIFKNNDYVGKLLSCNNFETEIKEFTNLDEIDPEANHRSKLISSSYTTITKLTEKLDKIRNKEQKEQITKLYNCLKKKKLYDNNSDISKNYGYIVSTKVGTSFLDNELNIFNKTQIIQILENLKESIGDLIQKLYNKEYIHGDIKFANMTLDKNLKVYFIDFGFMTKYKDITFLLTNNHQFSDILNIFFQIMIKFKNYNVEDDNDEDDEKDDFEIEFENELKNKNINKEKLIQLLNNEKFQKGQQYSNYTQLLEKTKLKFIDYSCFFHSLKDNEEYKLKDIYTECIEPIAKNIDIYALSLFIYKFFIGFNDGKIVNIKLFSENIQTQIRNIS